MPDLTPRERTGRRASPRKAEGLSGSIQYTPTSTTNSSTRARAQRVHISSSRSGVSASVTRGVAAVDSYTPLFVYVQKEIGKGLHGAPVGGFLFKYQLPPTSWGRPASLKTTLLNATRFCSAEARPGKCLSSPAVHMGSGPVGSGSCLLAWVKSGAIRAQPVRSAPLIANAPEGEALQGAW